MLKPEDMGHIGYAVHISDREFERLFENAKELVAVDAEGADVCLEYANGTLVHVHGAEVRERALVRGVIYLETYHNSYRLRAEKNEETRALFKDLCAAIREARAFVRRGE